MSHDRGLPEGESDAWRTLLAEADELAAEYREEGWETQLLHPGDVTPVFGEAHGLDALVPGSEYEQVSDLVDSHEFDQSRVYRHAGSDRTYLLCVFESTDGVAVLVPLYVESRALERLYGHASETGETSVHVRPLADDERATFTIADPELLLDG